MKKILIPIILSVLVAVSSCGPKRYLTTSRAPGVGLDTINYGAYNNDPSADKARPAFMKANGPIREYNRLQLYNLEPTELAILRGAVVTTAELNRISGVTSAVQTQINNRIRTVDSTGNAAGNYVTRKALMDTVASKAPINNATFTGSHTIPLPFTAGTTTVTSMENYSIENYGATGTGDIVLSTGATLTTVNITDVIKLTPTASPPAGATEGMIYADTDHHLYYYNGTSWVSMTD